MNLFLLPAPGAVPSASDPCLSFDWTSLNARLAAGGNAQPWEDYLDASAAEAVASESWAVSGAWSSDETGDITEFDGVSLADCHRFFIWILEIQPAFKLAAALTAAVARHAPKALACETNAPSSARRVIEAFAARKGLPLTWLGSPADAGSSLTWKISPVVWSPAKRAVATAMNAVRRAAAGPTAVVAFYPGQEHVLDELRRLGVRLTFAELPAPSALGRLLLTRPGVLTGARSPARWKREDRTRLEAMDRRWAERRASAALEALLAHAGVPVASAVTPALDAIMGAPTRELAWACRELNRYWDAENPALALIPSDGAPLPRLISHVARRRGVPCAALLHGLPYRFWPEYRTVSHLLAWGPELKRCYDEIPPLSPQSVEAVGAPFVDDITASGAPAALRSILVFSQPYNHISALGGACDPERHILAAVDAAAGRGAKVVVKIHPAESLEYYERLLAGRDAVVVKDGAARDLIAAADLVIGPFSTTLLETMLLGKPLLCANLTRDRLSAPFDGNHGIRPLSSAEELKLAVNRFAADPAGESARLRAPYAALLAGFAGPAGAATRAAKRLAELSGCISG